MLRCAPMCYDVLRSASKCFEVLVRRSLSNQVDGRKPIHSNFHWISSRFPTGSPTGSPVDSPSICPLKPTLFSHSKGGFAFLPFLWLLNFCWFYKIAYRSEAFTEQKAIKRYINMSGIGVIVWAVILISWNIYFQLNRATAEWGDALSFVLPAGYA